MVLSTFGSVVAAIPVFRFSFGNKLEKILLKRKLGSFGVVSDVSNLEIFHNAHFRNGSCCHDLLYNTQMDR